MDLFNLQANLSLDSSNYQRGIASAKQSAVSFSQSLSGIGNGVISIGNTISSFGNTLTSLGKQASAVTAAVGTVLTASFTKAKSFIGTYESAMTVFNRKLEGGEEASKKLYNALVDVAKGSSFAQEHLVSAGQTLVAMGLDADTTTKYVQTATNAIAGIGGSGAQVEEMAELFGRLSMQTNLYTQDLNQLVHAGIPAWDILATKYGTTREAVMDMARKGLIPATEALQTMTDALNETDSSSEMFKYSINGLAASLKSGTLTGVLDSLNTSFRTFALRLLDLDPRLESGTKNIKKLNSALTSLGNFLEKAGEKFNYVGKWAGNAFVKIQSALDYLTEKLDQIPTEQLDLLVKVILNVAVAAPALLVVGTIVNKVGNSISGLGKILNVVGGSFGSFADSVGGMFSPLMSVLDQKTNGVASQIASAAPKILKALLSLFNITAVIAALMAGLGILQNKFGDKISEIAKTVKEKGPEFINNFADGITKSLPKLIEQGGILINTILDAIITNLPAIVDGGIKIIGALISGMIQQLPKLLEQLGTIMVQLIGTITENLPKLLSAGADIITNLLKGITSKIPEIFPKIGQMVKDIIQTIKDKFPDLLKAGVDLVSEILKGMAKEIPSIIPLAFEMLLDLINTLLDEENINKLIDAGEQIVNSIVDGIIDALPGFIDKAPELIEKFVTIFLKNLPKIWAIGATLVIKLIAGIVSEIPHLIEKIPDIIEGIVRALGEGWEALKEAGAKIVDGIWAGIQSVSSSFFGKISNFCGGIVDTVKNSLGIHSPSRIMRDLIGENLALGIGVGFETNIDDVSKDMTSSLGNLTKDLATVEIPYNASISSKTNAGLVNGLSSFFELGNNDLTIKLTADGLTSLATVIYDPLRKVAQQKGVALNA